ncbi:FG-GAP repeat domain-containing protein [Chiayiivirga flava]|uniref:VCBS repeat-containing protein n=1 Tax=Chiayiivirga flava TaxID=659595 RepID=A0A7W8FYX7_9GAMM|nr:VCBS repeat-containing protein [Chiayiivirga flava]MBB5207877.1 hypothetical protein [Chiayiivirga flava]
MSTRSLHGTLLLFGLALAGRIHAEALPFAPEEALAAVTGITLAQAVDLDADGDEDILAARGGGSGEIGWLRNDRSGFAAFEVLHTISEEPPSAKGAKGALSDAVTLTLADLDADHQLDLVVGAENRRLYWIRRNGFTPGGAPDFSERGRAGAGFDGIVAVAAGRLDADQYPDLLVVNAADPYLYVLPNNGTRPIEFREPDPLPVGNTVDAVEAAVLADLDDDGLLDVAYAGPSAGGFQEGLSVASVFRFAGTANEGLEGPMPVFERNAGAGLRPRFDLFAAAPLDTTGPALVFATTVFDDAVPLLSEVRVLHSVGGGAFGDAVVLDSSNDARHRAVAFEDLDRNGDADLLLARSDALLRVENSALPPAGGAVALPVDGDAGRVLLAFDVDLDGDRDIVRARDDGSLHLLRNTRLHGRSFVDDFVPRTAVDVADDGAPFVGTVEIARVPGRQRFAPDTLLFTDFTAGRLHRMGGFFRAPPPLEDLFVLTPPTLVLDDVGAARRLAIADLDLDGDADFLLGNGESAAAPAAGQNRMFVGRMRRDGVDVLPLGCTEADDLRGVAVGDMTGDGVPEIAYAAEDNDRVALVFRIDCLDEFLVSTPQLGLPNRPNAVAIADLDGDLFGDLVVAARADDEGDTMGDLLGWYRFDPAGGGALEPLRRIGRVDGARELLVVDLDRDGRPDLVTSAGSTPEDPARGAVLLFRNLGPQAQPDALFEAPRVLLGGVVGPGGAAFSDIDHDGDLDLFAPSEAVASSAEQRAQCGVAFAEQIGPLQFAAARCLDRGTLEGRYSRVALADLDGDGVDDVGATSFPDGRLGLFAAHRPFQFLLRLRDEPTQRLIGEGTESCPYALALDHLGHPGEGPMGVSSLRVDVPDFSTPALIGALVLRRDDGDGVPEPDDDTELGRDALAEINEVATGMRWTLDVPPAAADAAVLPGSALHWLCVLGPPRIANTRLRLGIVQTQARLVDLEGGVAVDGLQRNAIAPGFELRARRVFSDGLEE